MSRRAPPPDTARPCPCGLPALYEGCCGRYHRGPLALQAPDPTSLMRSRYSGFVLDLRSYLLDTWHPQTRPAEIEPPEPSLRWLGLQVVEAPPAQGDEGMVSFVVRYKIAGRAHRMAETSEFRRVEGRWYYLAACSAG